MESAETESATHVDVSLLKLAVNDSFQIENFFFFKEKLFGSDHTVESLGNLKTRKSTGDSWQLLPSFSLSLSCFLVYIVPCPTVILLSYCGTS